MIHCMRIDGFLPAPLNKLVGNWQRASRLKAHDRDVIGRAFMVYGIPKATGKRRVDLLLIMGKGQRACDPDAHTKSTFDALVACGALFDDTKNYVQLGDVKFARWDDAEPCTVITLQDL